MATSRFVNGKYRYTIRRKKLLPKPIYLSFENKKEGDAYVADLEILLDQGIVPTEYLEHQVAGKLHSIIDEYIRCVFIKTDSKKLLHLQQARLENITVDRLTYNWCENWIKLMKSQYNLAPSTIKKHVGALARCMDWALTKDYILTNHLRRLPVGYATYTEDDVIAADVDRVDEERERRLEDGEEDKIRQVVVMKYKPANKQRYLEIDNPAAMMLMFNLAIETGMRMREIYTLDRIQVELKKKTINLTKTKNGDKRQVPMSTPCERYLKGYLKNYNPEKYLFPWFRGVRTDRELKAITSMLSGRWARIFEHAECVDLHFHDLRHEATSRIYERTTLSDVEISKITGHKTLKMLARYANLRASDLANKLW